MEQKNPENLRHTVYALLCGLIMVGGTFLTLVVLSVYAKPTKTEVAFDLAPLLTPALPADNVSDSSDSDLMVFTQRNVFEPLVTPIPTATKVPKPVPTATVPPLGLHWKLTMVSDGMCGITDFAKEFHVLNVGEELQGARIKEVNADAQTVTIQDILQLERTRVLSMSSGAEEPK